jgi:hypothetical protein
MPYNIYLNSPQLAVNENRRKYYLYVINKNNKLFNKKFQKYTPIYYRTCYNSIYTPNVSIVPY